MVAIPQKPPWVNDDPNVPPTDRTSAAPDDTDRDNKGQWVPGASGNPNGRPPGVRNRRNVVAAEFEKEGSAVARVVIDKALEGDMAAASLVLTRISPPMRARPPTVEFDLDPSLTIEEQGQQILLAMSRGQVDPDTARMLLDCLCAYAGLRDVTLLLEELRKLYAKHGVSIPGGVLTVKELENGTDDHTTQAQAGQGSPDGGGLATERAEPGDDAQGSPVPGQA